mmetsp:Transcript_64279/g.167146  ORF Transcript_64279/g.167146 Transcript_64279/m.167146 type:complete len:249 (+) Transcript_64279:168-914(+)
MDITSPMDSTGGDCRFAPRIQALTAPWPTAVHTSPSRKHSVPYCGSSSPKTWNDTHAAEVVNRIMVAAEAAATRGLTPISSISGPFTMPPPTPRRPARMPASVQMSGYLIVVFPSHRMSWASKRWPAKSFLLCSAISILLKIRPNTATQGMEARDKAQKPAEPHSTPMMDPWPLPLRIVSATQPAKHNTSRPIFPHGVNSSFSSRTHSASSSWHATSAADSSVSVSPSSSYAFRTRRPLSASRSVSFW